MVQAGAAAAEAGRALVDIRRLPNEALRVVSRELMPRDAYLETCNAYFRQQVVAA